MVKLGHEKSYMRKDEHVVGNEITFHALKMSFPVVNN